jgi:translocation and assembly module TamA
MIHLHALGALFFLLPAAAAAETTRICNIEIEAAEAIDFSGVEENWLCGDPESHAWQSIPLSQQKVFLRSFLQSRGYHEAEIAEEGGQLLVRAGAPAELKELRVEGGPPGWKWWKRWGLTRRAMSPDTVDDAESWTKRSLQERGYPCPVVDTQAIVDTGELRLGVLAGLPYRFGPIESEGQPDLDPAILDRFRAFDDGQAFDIRLLELTSTRILREELYLSTYYDVLCDQNQNVRIVRRYVPAQPRLFTAGAGFDTDRGPLARARFRWSRLSPAANSLEAMVFASLREQSLEARFHYHFLEDLSKRWELIPSLLVRREQEEKFTTVTTQIGTSLANSWEMDSFRLGAEAGPELRRVTKIEGAGPERVDSLRWLSRVTGMSHLFEYYLTDPRAGWNLSLEVSSQVPGLISEQSVHRAFLEHQMLFNLGSLQPPFLILGWRGHLASYFLNQRSNDPPDIPVSDRFFLGGDDNIRGFSRKEIPGIDRGFLTAVYQGVELRAGPWLPAGLQPFLFYDWAKGGLRARHLERAYYHAPGFGIRYESPIGTIRASLGRGFIGNRRASDPMPHWQMFFSFGREF